MIFRPSKPLWKGIDFFLKGMDDRNDRRFHDQWE